MTELPQASPADPVSDRKTITLAKIATKHLPEKTQNLLVVGCGTGREAGVLARYLRIDTTGIDIGHEYDLNHTDAAPAKLRIMDAHAMTFPDAHFDFVYSFHALEHMTDPGRALREMARVLRPNGIYLLGTPNKSRMVGYLGSGTSRANKLRWNLQDWADRLRGRWRNETGAHAGFTQQELHAMTSTSFANGSRVITDEYYSRLYSPKLVRLLKMLGIARWVYPCVYVLGRKHPETA